MFYAIRTSALSAEHRAILLKIANAGDNESLTRTDKTFNNLEKSPGMGLFSYIFFAPCLVISQTSSPLGTIAFMPK